MAKFYGTVKGRSQSLATREGSDMIRSSAQSYNGSVVIELDYDAKGELRVAVGCMEGSQKSFKSPTWEGTFKEFERMLQRSMQRRNI